MNHLGKFIREIKIEGVTFYCRGLTVGEYIDLSQKCQLRLTPLLYAEVASAGVVGWENMYDSNGVEVPYHPVDMNVNNIGSMKVLEKLGRFIFHDLTTLSDEDAEKFRGYMRFLYWSSDEKNEKKRETFNCETCLSKGLAISRPCGRFSMEFRKDAAQGGGDDEESFQSSAKVEKKIKNRMAKYGNKKIAQKKKVKEKKIIEEMSREDSDRAASLGGRVLILDGFKFPECPISWVDDWVKTSADIMYQAEKSDNVLFSGGFFDQPYQFYRASKIIKGEYGSIEAERLEKERKKKK